MRAQFLLPSLFCLTGLVWLSSSNAIAETPPATNPAPVKTQQLQLVPSPDTAVGFNNIPGLFNRAVNNNTGRFYDYTNILGQFNSLFGWRTFPQGSYFDNLITRDAKLTETLYLDFPRINILAMAKSLTEPELKQYNTGELLDTKS